MEPCLSYKIVKAVCASAYRDCDLDFDEAQEKVWAIIEPLLKERDRYKEVLKDLVWLKILKDNEGKTAEYMENMPKAWESAKAALAERDVVSDGK